MRCIVTTLLLSSATTSAFGPSSSLFGTRFSTRLHISSWDARGPPHRWAEAEAKLEDPAEKIQSYLDEPSLVSARADVDGTCLVSGLVNTMDRTDQTVFDLLNNEMSAFLFDKIVAFVNDEKFAKKRLLSRSARYTGLLDKLDFMQATEPGALPTPEQMEGVRNWVAFVDTDVLETVNKIIDICNESPSLMNVAILMVNAQELDPDECKTARERMHDRKYEYNMIAVGELQDYPEGKEYYQLRDFGSEEGVLPKDAKFSRDEALRLVTDTLQLTCGGNEAFTVSEVYDMNQTEARLIKGLREAGYARVQETDHMVQDGAKKYEKAIEDYKTGSPESKRGNYKNWWEAPEFQETSKKAAEKSARADQEEKDGKQEEIEKIATEWAKREFFRKSMAGTLDLSEEEYIESVWERALFEGNLKYRQAHGESPDEEMELADFQAVQERKKETMLKRAKEELQDLLDEDDDTEDDDGDDE